MEYPTPEPSCTVTSEHGGFCKGPSMQGAPFPICPYHLLKLLKSEWQLPKVHSLAIRNTPQRKTEALVSLWSGQRRLDVSVVYYVRIGDYIKIGYSADLISRMQSLRVRESDLLATEPGGRSMERARHQQFNDIRVDRREDFRPTERLMDHIENVKKRCGDPAVTYFGWPGGENRPSYRERSGAHQNRKRNFEAKW